MAEKETKDKETNKITQKSHIRQQKRHKPLQKIEVSSGSLKG